MAVLQERSLTAICYVILMLSAAAVSATEAACSTQEAVALKFSMTSRRNETRHRVITVDLTNEDPSGAGGNARGQVSLDVSPVYSECGGLERVLVGTVATAKEPRPHRPDYELFPGLGYYKLHTTGQLWNDARRKCIEENAHLIVINSDREADVVKEFSSRNPKIQAATRDIYFFSGFHDKFVEGQYVTLTGEPLGSTKYTKWAPGQPNKGTGENYGGFDKNGLLHDIPNDWKLAFICEQEL